MTILIESLESRTLLSATVLQAVSVEQAVTALGKEANQARIDVAAATRTGAVNVRALKADLQRLKHVPGNAALLKRFSKQEQAAYNEFKKDAAAVATSVSKDTKHAIADGINFILQPGNVKVTAKLAADLTALQKLTTSGQAQKLGADVNSSVAVVTGDLNSISAVNSGDAKTVDDAATAKTGLAIASGTLQADASALEGDLTTLIEAVEAVQTA